MSVNVKKPIFNCLNYEDERLKTFENWPSEFINRKEMAATGMFYTGQADKSKCYFCGVEIHSWQPSDNPVTEHLRWSVTCPLLRRRPTNNIPNNLIELNRLLPVIGDDTCGLNEIKPQYQRRNLKHKSNVKTQDQGRGLKYTSIFFSWLVIILTYVIFTEIYPNLKN